VILNLCYHPTTPGQLAAGVVEPKHKAAVQVFLGFDDMPSVSERISRSQLLAQIAVESGHKSAMIDWNSYLLGYLEDILEAKGIHPCHAVSGHETVEEMLFDGTSKKITRFRHVGFVPVGNKRVSCNALVHRVVLSNHQVLRIEEDLACLRLCTENLGEVETYICTFTDTEVHVMGNSGDATGHLVRGLTGTKAG